MNKKMVLYMVGRILQFLAILLCLPITIGIIYNEAQLWSYIYISAVSLVLGILLTRFFSRGDRTIFAKEGFVIVALAWIVTSAVGALPSFLTGEIPNYIEAFFETVSGFTTTGASIINNIEALSHTTLFWRSFTHWVGGMGVLVFIMAIFPSESGRTIHIMRAEIPGPIVGKIVPKIRDTAKILYLIYIAITVVGIIMLWCGDMNLFESIVHMFGTAGTGGFGIKNDGMVGYSAYSQWVIGFFMLLFGINFNIYFLILVRQIKSVFKSTELWCYLSIIGVATVSIAINIYSLIGNFADTIRHAFFQVASIITTTGYATYDFTEWPYFSQVILIILMFIGGCAGSTAGGFKITRVILLFKVIRRDFQRMLHPRSIGVIKFEGKRVDTQTLDSLGVYTALYFVLFFVILLLLSLDGNDFVTTFSSTAACFNNIGPALGNAGPMNNYSFYSDGAKLLLSFAMLLGRLELYPILLAFSPSTWTKK